MDKESFEYILERLEESLANLWTLKNYLKDENIISFEENSFAGGKDYLIDRIDIFYTKIENLVVFLENIIGIQTDHGNHR